MSRRPTGSCYGTGRSPARQVTAANGSGSVEGRRTTPAGVTIASGAAVTSAVPAAWAPGCWGSKASSQPSAVRRTRTMPAASARRRSRWWRSRLPSCSRRRAEAVGELGAEVGDLAVGAGRGDPAVDGEAHRLLGDPALGQAQVEAEPELDGCRRRRDRLAGQLVDRLLEQAAIGLVADRPQVAVLLGAEQVAGAADLEVAGGDPEAGAEVGELDDRRQACACLLGQGAFRRHQQEGEGEPVRAADPAAELVELGEAEAVRAVDDQGVGVGDVEAVLDDGRGEQDVGARLEEGVHRLLQLALVHLPVGDDDAGLGHELADQPGHGAHRGDPVVDEERLAAAGHLGEDRLAHHLAGGTAGRGSGRRGGRAAGSR